MCLSQIFLPHLNYVATLPCDNINAIAMVMARRRDDDCDDLVSYRL